MRYSPTKVLIGRFEPVTIAHAEIIRKCVESCGQLIIVVGSANQPRTYKNPWNFLERRLMLKSVLDEINDNTVRIDIVPVEDLLYNDPQWAINVATAVFNVNMYSTTETQIVGHMKDNDTSTYYLDMFPQWDFEDCGFIEPMNATDVRSIYFKKDVNMRFVFNTVPSTVYRILDGWKSTEEFNKIVEERLFIEKYKQQFASLPYPVSFNTVDAVVIKCGHVLMVERGDMPGKGLYALPGGFLNANTDRTLRDAMIRELFEETCIREPKNKIINSIKANRTFDHKDRSQRGRTITQAFLIDLGNTGELPRVKGADDAAKAFWVPISELKGEQVYEDHKEIILEMVKYVV